MKPNQNTPLHPVPTPSPTPSPGRSESTPSPVPLPTGTGCTTTPSPTTGTGSLQPPICGHTHTTNTTTWTCITQGPHPAGKHTFRNLDMSTLPRHTRHVDTPTPLDTINGTRPLTLTQAITADTPTGLTLPHRPHCTNCAEPGNITHEGIALNHHGQLVAVHWCSDPACAGVRVHATNTITRPIAAEDRRP